MISTSPLGPTPIDMLNAFEIAALVYDDGVSVDHLMSYFAEELQEHGRRIGGVVQLPPEDENARSRTLRIYDLMTGDVIPIKQHLGEGSGACCLDTQALAEGAVRIRNAVEAGVDLVFISKFSRQEVAGKGFRDEFAVAVAAGIPILTSVKRPMVDEWLKFTGGIGTLMACRLRTLRALINLLAYTFSFGNGVTATLSMEDPTTGGTMTTAAAPPSGQYGSRRNGSSFTYGALQAPDVVGNVNITQAWGSAQISGGLHQDYGSTAAIGTKWGYGVQGGVKFFTPQIGVGDWIKFQGTYSVGAIQYTMWPEAFSLFEKSSGAGASNAYTDLGADAVWSSSTGIKQTTAYSIYGEYAHNIIPQLEFDVGGGFAHFANTNVYYGNNGNTYGQLEGEVQFQWKPAKNLFIMPYVEYRDLSFNSNTVADYGLAHSNVQAIDFGLRFQRNF